MVHRTLLLLLFFLTAYYAIAQVAHKGFYTDLRLNYVTNEEEKAVNMEVVSQNNIETSINVGYGIHKNWILGLGYDYTNLKGKAVSVIPYQISPGFTVRATSYRRTQSIKNGIAIFGLYHKKTLGHIELLAEVRGFLGSIKTNDEVTLDRDINIDEFRESFTTNNYAGLSISPGLLFPVSKRLGFILNVGGIQYYSEEGLNLKQNKIELNLSPSNWMLGVFYDFSKKQE